MDKAVILSTGEELITGKVVDTNSSYIADKLFFLGVEVVAILKVGDDRERLLWAFQHAAELGNLIIGTGELGPTVDDLTSDTVAQFLHRPLELDERVAAALKRRFEDRGRPWTENNLKQAQFPKGAEVIPNPRGTAPGFRVELGERKWLIWLSGVPREMVGMMQESVVPWISQTLITDEIATTTFKVYGLTESKLDDILKPIQLPHGVQLSFRAHYPDLSLRLTYRGGNEESEQFQGLKARIGNLIQPYVYGEGDETLEEIVGKLLRKNGWTLALAESCTGGFISHRITRIPGSSDYFNSSAVTYSNDAKMALLGVKKTTLKRFGPVSRETAMEMAQGIKKKTDANVGMSVTGIAGPEGGTPEIPVGTVWIGMAQLHGDEAQIFHLQGDRERVIQGASQAVLHWLRKTLIETP